jgi:hypothetical protein
LPCRGYFRVYPVGCKRVVINYIYPLAITHPGLLISSFVFFALFSEPSRETLFLFSQQLSSLLFCPAWYIFTNIPSPAVVCYQMLFYRLVFLTFILVQFCYPSERWQYSLDADLTVALNTFSSNWKSKDAGSLAWVSKMTVMAKKRLYEKALSETTVKLIFGQTKLQDKSTKRWSSPEKSSDDIQVQSVLRFDIGKFINPFLSVHLKSQFVDNRRDTNKRYLNPVEFTESLGFARDLLKTKSITWNSRFGCALRQRIDFDHPMLKDSAGHTLYVVDIVKDGGGEIVSEFKFFKPQMLMVNSKLKIFSAFISSQATKKAENDFWRYPDVSLETSVSFFLTRNLILSYYYNIIYDREFDKMPRSKQTLGAGLGIDLTSGK